MRIFERVNLFVCRFDVNTVARKRVERLQHVIVDLSIAREFVREKGGRRVFGFQKRERMFADPEIPVGMADPRDIEIILKSKWQIQIGPANQFIENYPIINSLD